MDDKNDDAKDLHPSSIYLDMIFSSLSFERWKLISGRMAIDLASDSLINLELK